MPTMATNDQDDCVVKCRVCGFSGKPSEYRPAGMTAYHDLRCPKCGTTNLDTSDVLRVWPDYGYGKNNFLAALTKGDVKG